MQTAGTLTQALRTRHLLGVSHFYLAQPQGPILPKSNTALGHSPQVRDDGVEGKPSEVAGHRKLCGHRGSQPATGG